MDASRLESLRQRSEKSRVWDRVTDSSTSMRAWRRRRCGSRTISPCAVCDLESDRSSGLHSAQRRAYVPRMEAPSPVKAHLRPTRPKKEPHARPSPVTEIRHEEPSNIWASSASAVSLSGQSTPENTA
ncbi:uncharacterized protein L969DRAFT_43158 [Mixia osmundae IAM 14324]|uniref:Uncharacterized protein n=1 Tax=Mixia osmundae (strain CBS 9802 / IAM 14324 / JCM 22182 / KY 12970) TaxID=764103 RepID=G7DTI7_MIXOS|nr:uncharacterized protein L969DRAFT_43158 [Mixia osmundae IAM 14324]KEI42829.1 hypothetical protein L969DRAFT_43158 [Mixia osmundae IAM 14324]GAA93834.1 hypothetical protein E5Q_00480 [Mixia osmundae IAM 14324]